MLRTDDILNFWLHEVGPAGWYAVDADVDTQIRDRFMSDWERAQLDSSGTCNPRAALAYIVLTDQFPRNMFRNDAQAFATDLLARKTARQAIHHRWDRQVPEPERQFFYLPLMHSEVLADQDRCVRLFLTRMPETGAENLLHAQAHRNIIRRFGRFPYRNAVLGRHTTPEEKEFLEAGGYMAEVRAIDPGQEMV